jgi:bifunctional enzyme CysN/CysC
LVGRSYELRLTTQETAASITNIGHRVNIDTLAHEPARSLELNDIARCKLATSKALIFEPYARSRALGGFILIDPFHNATVAAGMITHALRRGSNVHPQKLSIEPAHRERLNGHRGQVVWFTGLSGSGKSTLANALEVALHDRGLRTYLLDGDNLRHGLNRDLGFTEADRVENIRRAAEVARVMADAGLVVLTAFISPYSRDRDMARDLVGPQRFMEVYVDTPLEVCEARDVKGLYRKARLGEIPNMTGIQSPYEAPEHPDHRITGIGDSPLDAVIPLLRKVLDDGK